MTYEDIQKDLKQKLSPHRFIHVEGVAESARSLAKRYGADPKKAQWAGLVHDCAKELTLQDMQLLVMEKNWDLDSYMMNSRALLHGPAGSVLAERRYGISDKEILRAVYYHTTGCPGMKLMDKIIFLADYVEPSRHFPGVDTLRCLADRDLDGAVLYAYDCTIRHLLDDHLYIYELTLLGRNDLILHMPSELLEKLP